MEYVVKLPAVKAVDAHGLQNRKSSKSVAACDAADLVDGLSTLQNPTIRVAAVARGVSQPYVVAALRLSPAQRDAVRQGMRPLILPRPRLPVPKPDPQRKLAEVVAEIGLNGVLDLLAANEKPRIAA